MKLLELFGSILDNKEKGDRELDLKFELKIHLVYQTFSHPAIVLTSKNNTEDFGNSYHNDVALIVYFSDLENDHNKDPRVAPIVKKLANRLYNNFIKFIKEQKVRPTMDQYVQLLNKFSSRYGMTINEYANEDRYQLKLTQQSFNKLF